MAQCPKCEHMLRLSKDVKVEDLVTCPECHWLLEVVSLNGPELDFALRDEGWDDWEDEV
jgi:lysine biosynthesis protein LysW